MIIELPTPQPSRGETLPRPSSACSPFRRRWRPITGPPRACIDRAQADISFVRHSTQQIVHVYTGFKDGNLRGILRLPYSIVRIVRYLVSRCSYCQSNLMESLLLRSRLSGLLYPDLKTDYC